MDDYADVETWRVMMAVKVSVIVAAFGFLIFITGIALGTINLSMHDYCSNEDVRAGLSKECEIADRYVLGGFLMAVIGLIVFLLGGAFTVAWNPKPARRWFNCPYCHQEIYYETSPVNCVYCGFPMNWPRGKIKT